MKGMMMYGCDVRAHTHGQMFVVLLVKITDHDTLDVLLLDGSKIYF